MSDRKKPKTQAVVLAVLSVLAVIGLTMSLTGYTWPVKLGEPEHVGMSAAQGTGTCTPAPPNVTRRIAIMGDSLSTPYGASTPERSWPVMVKNQAATHGWVVGLHGIGSTTASRYLPGQDLYYVTEQVRNSDPDILVVSFRANEQLQGQTPDQLKTNLLALIDAVRDTPATADTQVLIWNPPLMWYHAFASPSAQEAYIAKLWEVRAERNACWVDFRPFFPQSGPDTFSHKLLFDDIHYSDEAHATIATGNYHALLRMCGL